MDSVLKDLLIAHKPGSAIADMGLKKLGPMLRKSEINQEARATGDFFLKAIADKGDEGEKALASTALKATASPKISNEYALILQGTVLSAIAAGTMGGAAAAIAGVGAKFFNDTYFSYNEESQKYAMSDAFREGIGTYGTTEQKVLADKINTLGSHTYYDAASAMNFSLMKDIAGGAPCTAAQSLARAGGAGFSEVRPESLKEGGKFLAPLLELLSSEGTPEEKVLASLGQEIPFNKNTDSPSYHSFQMSLLASVGVGISSPVNSLISLYNDLMDGKKGVAYYSREFYGSRVLDTIASQAPKNLSAVAEAIARSARDTGGRPA